MGEVTYYVDLPFIPSDDGIALGEAVESLSANAAVMRADALSRKPSHVGAVTFSRSGDSATGEFGDASRIRKFGDVPDDMSALRRSHLISHFTSCRPSGRSRTRTRSRTADRRGADRAQCDR